MDRLERADSPQDNMLRVLAGLQATIWTSLPGIIQSFDATKQTAVIQPALKAWVQASDGSFSWVTLPLLVDCPVQFAGGGGVSLTYPLAKGDECLVVFASRCIDAWWQSGGVQVQAELRMHELSDGFCIPGIKSVPRVIAGISTTTAQLRNDAGTVMVEVDPAGILNLNAANVNINGVLTINGQAYLDHIHDETQPATAGNHSGKVVP